MRKEELQAGKKYWFLSRKEGALVELTLMNKVHQRSAYRFAPTAKQKPYVIHSSRLDSVYDKKREAKKAERLFLSQKALRDKAIKAATTVGYYTGTMALNPPNLRDWAVARGFSRKPSFGRW